MCGLYGRIGPADEALDHRSTASLHHRGPDDAGLWLTQLDAERTLALGQTRLSIVDLSAAGHQPMQSADGRHVLVFNGEIYNFPTLREQLQKSGRVFTSHSDTEVLLYALIHWGEAALQKLEGMFVFALWDRQERTLLVARDAVGIKPLYWRQTEHGLTFASELKALLVDPSLPRLPNRAALAAYLQYLYIPVPQTAIEGVFALQAGHLLRYDAKLQGKSQITPQHWQGFATGPKLPLNRMEDARDALTHLLQEVVNEHMTADVPVGAFLSGGIDSGLIVAMMAKQRRDRGDKERLHTYTVGFGHEGRNWDETARARQIAQALGVAHTVIHVPAESAPQRLDAVVDHFDEPFANPTAIAHDVLCEGARRDVTVALAGDGGDEAFAGYPRHRATQLLGLWTSLPEQLRQGLSAAERRIPEQAEALPLLRQARRFLRTGAGDFAETYRDWLTFLPQAELAGILQPQTRAALGQTIARDLGNVLASMDACAGADPVDRACYTDIGNFLPDNVLRESDRVSMRHALEVRVPLADRRVLQFGLQLPVAVKLPRSSLVRRGGGAGEAKKVLREVARQWLPRDVIDAPKQGFGAPMGAWLGTVLRQEVEQALDRDRMLARGVVQPEVAARWWHEHQTGQRDRTWPLWSLLVLERWWQRRIDQLVLPETNARIAVRWG
jgi:asparagine synthase (glutamine-hydrolysing)